MRKNMMKILILALFLLLPIQALAVSEGEQLPPFVAKDVDNKTVDLNKILGQKPIMFVFWASWCPSCYFEVPKLNALYKEFNSQGLEFYGINVDQNDSLDKAYSFMGKAQMRYPVIYDTGSVITQQYGVQGVPTIMIVNKKGEVTFKKNYVPEFKAEQFQEINQ